MAATRKSTSVRTTRNPETSTAESIVKPSSTYTLETAEDGSQKLTLQPLVHPEAAFQAVEDTTSTDSE